MFQIGEHLHASFLIVAIRSDMISSVVIALQF